MAGLFAVLLGMVTAARATSHSGDELLSLINGAADAATVQLQGTYIAAPGTTYMIYRPLNLVGSQAVLVNIRLIFLANMSLTGVSFVEQDCTFHVADPDACSPATPLLTVGYAGYPITSAIIRDVSMDFTRAYTGITFGSGPVSNVVIDGFSIVDKELSGITALGGDHITIQNGKIVGGTQKNVDDGIALYAVYGPLTDVSVKNVQAQNTFDLVGIGALMYYPIEGVDVSNSQCDRTAVCLYVKAGDRVAPPAGFPAYSTLSRLRITGITDTDTAGARYLSTIWIVGAGGAAAKDVTIDQVTTRARATSTATSRIKLYSDGASHLSGIVLSNLDMRVPAGRSSSGYTVTEGMFVQDSGSHDISNLALTNVTIDGANAYAVDSGTAQVDQLSMSGCSFTNMNLSSPGTSMFLIPYSYLLDGHVVLN